MKTTTSARNFDPGQPAGQGIPQNVLGHVPEEADYGVRNREWAASGRDLPITPSKMLPELGLVVGRRRCYPRTRVVSVDFGRTLEKPWEPAESLSSPRPRPGASFTSLSCTTASPNSLRKNRRVRDATSAFRRTRLSVQDRAWILLYRAVVRFPLNCRLEVVEAQRNGVRSAGDTSPCRPLVVGSLAIGSRSLVGMGMDQCLQYTLFRPQTRRDHTGGPDVSTGILGD